MVSPSTSRSMQPVPGQHGNSSGSSTPSQHRSHHLPSSFRASPSPSATSQSDDPDRDEEDDEEEEEEDDFTDAGASAFQLKERRNTLKARGSAALPVTTAATNSSETWQMSPASALNASAATLPHEILLHIFKYVAAHPPDLRNSLTVCKAWCLCGVELLWHRPSFHRISSLFKMIHIIRRPDQTFPYATFVRRFNFSLLSSDLEDSLFGRLSVCTRLERLTLTGCSMISDDTLASVLSHTKNLIAADFSEVTQLTDKSIITIAQSCPRLQGINFSGCKNITSDSLAALARNCKLLRRVKLCGCELVGDKAVSMLAQCCPVLLEVDLMNCPQISDTSIREVWKHSFHMRELRLAQCGKLTDLAFPAPNSSVGNVGAYGLESSAARIDAGATYHPHGGYHGGSDSAPASRGASPLGGTASLASNSMLQEQGVAPTSAGDNFPRTASIPVRTPMHTHLRTIRMFDHLRILDLTNCNTISDAAIEGIISNVPRIRNLILAKCTRLTNESVYSIARLGKNLHYLHLGHVSNLTDRAVCHLARSCTRLRYIDLACCPQLTDLSVLELAANLPKLRRIGLVRVTNLTDQAIYSLVERYTCLERIHLSYCENISVPAIYWLLERLTKLTHLSLTGVPAFRKPELQSMCREPPREFNAHQRTAFCVYSGKGVHELRKFLQNVYSGDDANVSQFGDLSPEVQRARSSMADSRDRRHPTRHGPTLLPDSAALVRPSGDGQQRHSSQHHQATQSDPQYSSRSILPPITALHSNAFAREGQQARLAPIGTANTTDRTLPSIASWAPFPAASVSSSTQAPLTTPNVMQVDQKEGEWWEPMDEDSREDREDQEEEAMQSEAIFKTPTGAGPVNAFNFRGSAETSGRGSQMSDQNASRYHAGPLPSPSSSSTSSAAVPFAGPGRTLGSAPSSQRTPVAMAPGQGGMAALATPPFASSSDYFAGGRTAPISVSQATNSLSAPIAVDSIQQLLPGQQHGPGHARASHQTSNEAPHDSALPPTTTSHAT